MYQKENTSIYKYFLRQVYKVYISLILLLNYFLRKKGKKKTSIFFGGAYSGNRGGTLVKVKRLKNVYSEDKINFNILYLLSNSIYYFYFFLKLFKNKIPIIHNQNGVFYPAWYNGNYKIMNKLMSDQLKLADYVFYQSKFCKYSSDKFLHKRKNKFEILYNACDLNIFRPRLNKKINKKKIKILMTGSFRSYLYPGLLAAIKSVSELKNRNNVELSIAGTIEKSLKKKILKIIKKNNLEKNIFFLGSYNQTLAPKIYRSHDIYYFFVHNAPCPNALIEAIASGLPVVYLNSGSCKEIVEKGGIAIKSKKSWQKYHSINHKSISSAINRIISNYSYYHKEARKSAIKKHDFKNWINRHDIIFKKYKLELLSTINK